MIISPCADQHPRPSLSPTFHHYLSLSASLPSPAPQHPPALTLSRACKHRNRSNAPSSWAGSGAATRHCDMMTHAMATCPSHRRDGEGGGGGGGGGGEWGGRKHVSRCTRANCAVRCRAKYARTLALHARTHTLKSFWPGVTEGCDNRCAATDCCCLACPSSVMVRVCRHQQTLPALPPRLRLFLLKTVSPGHSHA